MNENLLFCCSYIVFWKKGYQQFQEPRGTSVIKVKGIAKVTGNDTLFYTSKIFLLRKKSGYRIFSGDETKYIWDTPEYEIPPIVC